MLFQYDVIAVNIQFEYDANTVHMECNCHLRVNQMPFTWNVNTI